MGLEETADRLIDACIRTYDTRDPSNYEEWEARLRAIEDELRRAMPRPKAEIVARVTALRIHIAYEFRHMASVIEWSQAYLQEFSTKGGSYSDVVTARLNALHVQGRHEEEAQEALHFASLPGCQGSDLLYLLAKLGRRHPGSVPADQELWSKAKDAVEVLRGEGYDSLPEVQGGPKALEELVQAVVQELHSLNRIRAQEVLAQSSGEE